MSASVARREAASAPNLSEPAAAMNPEHAPTSRRPDGALLTAAPRGLPNFMVIGAPRCASTALCRALSAHPEVFITNPKETFFFSHQRKYGSREGWEWYHGLFRGVGPQHKAIGEGTTDYSDPTRLPLILPRLQQHVPECRFLYIVRHPLRRIESAWKLGEAGGSGNGDFCRAVRERAALLQFSSYWKVLDAYAAAFGRDRLHVVFQEDLKSRPAEVMRRCFEFLEVDAAYQVDASEPVNPSSQLRQRTRLAQLVRQTALADFARRLLPEGARSWIHQLGSKALQLDAAWDSPTRVFAVSELATGIQRFLQECGKPPDFWDLSDGDGDGRHGAGSAGSPSPVETEPVQ